AFAYLEEGRIKQITYKYHLVPFGEYLPLRKWLGFVARGASLEMDYAPGEKYPLLWLKEKPVAPLICFESLFGQSVRMQVKKGAEALLLITNDAWFKETAGMSQHSAYLILRAIE